MLQATELKIVLQCIVSLLIQRNGAIFIFKDIEVPSGVDGKRKYPA